MPERRQSSYPLLRQFREFYGEVARLRRIATDGRSVESDARQVPVQAQGRLESTTAPSRNSSLESNATAVALAEPPEADPETALTLYVWKAMAQYLDEKMFEVRHAPSALSRDLLEELVYIMAAFADETFICLVDWPGAAYWRDHLMELHFFRSQISGQAIFSRIDDLLKREDYGAPELCAVYLMALSLGFRGRYLRNSAAVATYRRRLYDRLVSINPAMRRESPRIFPEAYQHTVSEGAPVRLPEPKTWWLAVAGVVCLWLIVSTVAWRIVTASTRGLLKQTAAALAQAKSRSTDDATVKWTEEPFALRDGALRLELPGNLPMDDGAAGNGSSPAPATLLIAVTGPQDASPGPVDKVQAWLAGGMIVFPTDAGNMAPPSRAVQSVAPTTVVPSGIILGGTTELFSVNTGLAGQQLAQHPQFILPVSGPEGAPVDAVVLYVPGGAPAGS